MPTYVYARSSAAIQSGFFFQFSTDFCIFETLFIVNIDPQFMHSNRVYETCYDFRLLRLRILSFRCVFIISTNGRQYFSFSFLLQSCNILSEHTWEYSQQCTFFVPNDTRMTLPTLIKKFYFANINVVRLSILECFVILSRIIAR